MQIADRVVGFEYFKVNGSTGCPPEEPENSAPVISELTATPQAGFAPLPVKFDATATDEDDDALTYSWDFGDGGALHRRGPVAHLHHGRHLQGKVTVSATARTHVIAHGLGHTCSAPTRPATRFRVLVFSKTTGLPPRLDPGGHRRDQEAR